MGSSSRSTRLLIRHQSFRSSASAKTLQVFWARYQELPDWEKVLKNIERGELKIQRQADIMAAIRGKLEQYRNPWQELKVRQDAVCLLCGCVALLLLTGTTSVQI